MKSYEKKYSPLRTVFDLPKLDSRLISLKEKTTSPDFWNDPQVASKVNQEISLIEDKISLWDRLTSEIDELVELAKISEEDTSLATEVDSKLKLLSKEFKEHEFEVLLGEEYDPESCIMMIHAGAGGTESQDWVSMLLRMYLRYSEQHGFKTDILSINPGEEAGIKSCTLEINGPYAYGYLKGESGTHRLVRLSPFDADHARHTSFAKVEILPNISKDIKIKVDPKDLKIDTYRSSGAGGQHVNVTDSAVRITHIPSKITVSCQNERSQLQNKETALKLLKLKLYEQELQKQQEAKAKLKGEHVSASFGHQIRSYVLHPYKMVKDLRTKHEESNADKVLDGNLDPFIKSYIKYHCKNK